MEIGWKPMEFLAARRFAPHPLGPKSALLGSIHVPSNRDEPKPTNPVLVDMSIAPLSKKIFLPHHPFPPLYIRPSPLRCTTKSQLRNGQSFRLWVKGRIVDSNTIHSLRLGNTTLPKILWTAADSYEQNPLPKNMYFHYY